MIEGYIFLFSVFEVDIVLNRYYICYKIIVCEINIVCIQILEELFNV